MEVEAGRATERQNITAAAPSTAVASYEPPERVAPSPAAPGMQGLGASATPSGRTSNQHARDLRNCGWAEFCPEKERGSDWTWWTGRRGSFPKFSSTGPLFSLLLGTRQSRPAREKARCSSSGSKKKKKIAGRLQRSGSCVTCTRAVTHSMPYTPLASTSSNSLHNHPTPFHHQHINGNRQVKRRHRR